MNADVAKYQLKIRAASGPQFTVNVEIWTGKPTVAPHLDIDLKPLATVTELFISADYHGSGGQCQDTIGDYFAIHPVERWRVKVLRLLEMWDRWHLNTMRAGTRAQREALNGQPFINYDAQCHYLQSNTAAYEDRGYKYGHAWLSEVIPDNILEEITILSKELRNYDGHTG